MSSSPPYYVSVSSDDIPEESSVSTIAVTAVGTGHHMLKVQGYSRLKTMHGATGSYVESSPFKAAGYTWKIRCYPNGARPEDAGFVSMYLRRAADDANTNNAAADAAESVVHAEYELALVHHQSTLIKWPSHCSPASTHAFGESNLWGFPQFISAERLEGSRFLKDDCFAVRCKVTVVKEWTVKGEARPPGNAFDRFRGSIFG